jgi:hypothetical protein
VTDVIAGIKIRLVTLGPQKITDLEQGKASVNDIGRLQRQSRNEAAEQTKAKGKKDNRRTATLHEEPPLEFPLSGRGCFFIIPQRPGLGEMAPFAVRSSVAGTKNDRPGR